MSLSLQLAEVRLIGGLGGRLGLRLRPPRALPRLSQPLLNGTAFHRESLSGIAHGVTSTILAPVTAGLGAAAGVGLAAIDSWVLSGARAALLEAAGVIGATTAPQLDSAWFSSEYWRVAGFAALLTVPFLFAAAVQAIVASDLALLVRAAFCYLPLALLAVALAAPLTMLLLAATDQMCAAVSAAGSGGGARFLTDTASLGAAGPLGGTAFLAFAVGALTVAGALALAIEMLIREAAVYIVVLMLPLAFAAFVWPARRVWAVRTLELLLALILSKFAIVAVLSLAGAAFGASGAAGTSRLLTAMALVILAAFAPWGILRLLPFTELASGAAGEIRSAAGRAARTASSAADAGASLMPLGSGAQWTEGVPATMADEARAAGQPGVRDDDPPHGPDSRQQRFRLRGGPLGVEHETLTASSKPGHGEAGVDAPGRIDSADPTPSRTPPPNQTATSRLTNGVAAPRDAGAGQESARPDSQIAGPDSQIAGPDSPSAGPDSQSREQGLGSRPTTSDDFTAALHAEQWTWTPVELGLSGGWPPRFGPPDPGPAASEPTPGSADLTAEPAQPTGDHGTAPDDDGRLR